MKHVLSDGRTLFMKKEEIEQFFEEHELKGKKIEDIRPSRLDYMIANLADLEDDTFDYYGSQTDEGIGTDGKICFFFDDHTSVEVEISGSGPVILGYGTADSAEYEHVWGSCYKLTTVFKDVAGRTIKDVKVEKTEESMWFPSYCGMDLSDENEGAYSIEFILDDNTMMKMYGAMDWFNIDHCDLSGEELYGVTLGELLSDLNVGQLNSMFSESNEEEEPDYEVFSSTEIDYNEIDMEFGTFGFKDKEGDIIIKPQYLSAGEFRHDLCPVALNRTWYRHENSEWFEMHWGYIDQTGKTKIPFMYHDAYSFNRYGVAVVMTEDKNGKLHEILIGLDGEQIPGTEGKEFEHYYDYDDRFLVFDADWTKDDELATGIYDTRNRCVLRKPK